MPWVGWACCGTWLRPGASSGGGGCALILYFFFQVFPGKHEIGIIDVSFTVITDDSALVISEFLDYARHKDSVKAVVIRITNLESATADGEKLFFQIRSLREEKPVVIVVDDMVASRGYMMSLGANHVYAKISFLVESIGGIPGFPGLMIPRPLGGDVVSSGPFKLLGLTRRDWISTVDEQNQAFVQMVVSQRGERLRMLPEELCQARLYTDIESAEHEEAATGASSHG